MAKSIKTKSKSKPKVKKKVKPTKEEKEQAQYEAGERQKLIDKIIRNGGSIREITDPYGN